jgi:hypothetical protein
MGNAKENVIDTLEALAYRASMVFSEARYRLRKVIFFFQRGRRGWSDEDMWDACGYLDKVISGMLIDLADRGSSCGPKELEEIDEKRYLSGELWEEKLRSLAKEIRRREVDMEKLESEEPLPFETYLSKYEKIALRHRRAIRELAGYWDSLWD